jgi:hypothetical protein
VCVVAWRPRRPGQSSFPLRIIHASLAFCHGLLLHHGAAVCSCLPCWILWGHSRSACIKKTGGQTGRWPCQRSHVPSAFLPMGMFGTVTHKIARLISHKRVRGRFCEFDARSSFSVFCYGGGEQKPVRRQAVRRDFFLLLVLISDAHSVPNKTYADSLRKFKLSSVCNDRFRQDLLFC